MPARWRTAIRLPRAAHHAKRAARVAGVATGAARRIHRINTAGIVPACRSVVPLDRVRDDLVEQPLECLAFAVGQACEQAVVPLAHDRHDLAMQRAAVGGQRDQHDPAILLACAAFEQPLAQQRLGCAARLALVEIGVARQIHDRERAEGADGGDHARLGQRDVELVPVHLADPAVGSLRERVEAIGQKLIEPGLTAFHVES